MNTSFQHSWLIVGSALLLCASAFAQSAATPPSSATKKKVNFVAIGYDIQNNTKAQTMLQQMADAVKNTGGKATVIMAGADQAALDKALTEAMDSATGKGSRAAPTLVLKSNTFKSGEQIRVAIENPPTGKYAWIGFYPKGADDRDYLKYILLAGLDDNIYEDARAPDQPGTYNFRLYKDEGYEPMAISEDIIVAP